MGHVMDVNLQETRKKNIDNFLSASKLTTEPVRKKCTTKTTSEKSFLKHLGGQDVLATHSFKMSSIYWFLKDASIRTLRAARTISVDFATHLPTLATRLSTVDDQ
jgi:hypothetical protein